MAQSKTVARVVGATSNEDLISSKIHY